MLSVPVHVRQHRRQLRALYVYYLRGERMGGLIGFGGARAVGGPVNAGRAYLVGENGPEMFVPQGNGRVMPGGGGFSGDVNVNVDMSKGGGTGSASDALEFGRRVRVAVMDVIQNEQRPGGTLYRR